MSWKAITIILVLLILSSSIISLESGESSRIIIYGSHRCPACSGLKQFFDNTGLPYEFREIYDCTLSGCKLTAYGSDLAKIINIAGLEPYIPVSTVIDSNGYVVAIVQGRIVNKLFWNKLLSKSFRCGIEVYSDGKVGEIKDPEKISEVIKIVTGKDVSGSKLKSILKSCSMASTTNPPSTLSTTTISGENGIKWQLFISVITLALIIGSVILYIFIRKKSRH